MLFNFFFSGAPAAGIIPFFNYEKLLYFYACYCPLFYGIFPAPQLPEYYHFLLDFFFTVWDDNRFQGIPQFGKVTVSKPLIFFVVCTVFLRVVKDGKCRTPSVVCREERMSRMTPPPPPVGARLRKVSSVARLGGFEFDCVGKYWLEQVDKIWAGLGSVWLFSNT